MKITVEEAKNLFHAMIHNRKLILDYYGFTREEMDELEKFVKTYRYDLGAKAEIKLVKSKK